MSLDVRYIEKFLEGRSFICIEFLLEMMNFLCFLGIFIEGKDRNGVFRLFVLMLCWLVGK